MNDLEVKIRSFIIEEIQSKLNALDIPRESVVDDFDLVGSGVLDSLSFIELVGAVEHEFKFEMDFEDLDPSEFTRLNGFVGCALKNAGSA